MSTIHPMTFNATSIQPGSGFHSAIWVNILAWCGICLALIILLGTGCWWRQRHATHDMPPRFPRPDGGDDYEPVELETAL